MVDHTLKVTVLGDGFHPNATTPKNVNKIGTIENISLRACDHLANSHRRLILMTHI